MWGPKRSRPAWNRRGAALARFGRDVYKEVVVIEAGIFGSFAGFWLGVFIAASEAWKKLGWFIVWLCAVAYCLTYLSYPYAAAAVLGLLLGLLVGGFVVGTGK